jgi:hypothetical protein
MMSQPCRASGMKRSKLNPLDDRLVPDVGVRAWPEMRLLEVVVAAGARVLAADAPPLRGVVRMGVELVVALLRDETPLRGVGPRDPDVDPDDRAGGALASETSLKSKLIRCPKPWVP